MLFWNILFDWYINIYFNKFRTEIKQKLFNNLDIAEVKFSKVFLILLVELSLFQWLDFSKSKSSKNCLCHIIYTIIYQETYLSILVI